MKLDGNVYICNISVLCFSNNVLVIECVCLGVGGIGKISKILSSNKSQIIIDL